MQNSAPAEAYFVLFHHHVAALLEPRVMIRRCLFAHRNIFLVLVLVLLFAPLHVAAAADLGTLMRLVALSSSSLN